MPATIWIEHDSAALPIYFMLRDSSLQVWNNSSNQFLPYNAGAWADLANAMNQQGSSLFFYDEFAPDLPTGRYRVSFYLQAGGTPAEGDLPIGGYDISAVNNFQISLADVGSKTTLDIVHGAVLDILEILPDDTEGLANVLLDQEDGVEENFTVREALRLVLSALAGKLSGAQTDEVSIRNVADSKTRIIAEVDLAGNRTAVAYDVSD